MSKKVVDRLKLVFAVVCVLVVLSVCLTNPVFANIPTVQNVIVYNVGGTTYLNVTVFHDTENPSHHVDMIEVSYGSNTTDMTIGVQLSTTFTITYVVGPVADSPTATVRAHCNVHGWSSEWTGQIPEFPSSMMLMAFLLLISLITIVFRKAKLTLPK